MHQEGLIRTKYPHTPKRKIGDFLADSLISFFRLNSAGKYRSHFLERIAPVYKVSYKEQSYSFHCPNLLVHWRAETLFTKEPETIAWIDMFEKGDVFFDIGANIGVYSIYAAMKDHQVMAFEPDSLNYAELNKNIFLNRAMDRVLALPLALSDKEGVDLFHITDFSPGGALGNVGHKIDWFKNGSESVFRQAVLTCPLDKFLELCPQAFPNHLKIDVDGHESKIIRGADQTLQDPRIKSVLIELCEDLPQDRKVPAQLEEYGLRIKHRKEQNFILNGQKAGTVINYLFQRE